jgi:hypothetical protein
LDKLPFATLAHARFQETPEHGELFEQIPANQRRRLVEGTDLPLEQRQIVQRLEDEVLTLLGSGMVGDDVGAARHHHLVDIAADVPRQSIK